jgi:hypothetical protein
MIRKWVVCAGLVCCFGVVQATIYEAVGSDGSVSYSDSPGSADAKPVKLKPLSVSNVPEQSSTALSKALAKPNGPNKKAMKAVSVQIIQPKDGTTLWNQNEVEVAAAVTPGLEPNQAVRLLVNGREAEKNGSGRFVLKYLQRGEQILQTEVVGQDGKVLAQSGSVKVFIHRTAVKKFKIVKP